jgi:hypothetical protein
MRNIIAATLAVILLSSCGLAPALEAADEAPDLGYDPAPIATASDVCATAAGFAFAASEDAQRTLDVDAYYRVTANQYARCGQALDEATQSITDPELRTLWAAQADAVWDLVAWTDYGWTGTLADLEGTTVRIDAVTDAAEAVADWMEARNLELSPTT